MKSKVSYQKNMIDNNSNMHPNFPKCPFEKLGYKLKQEEKQQAKCPFHALKHKHQDPNCDVEKVERSYSMYPTSVDTWQLLTDVGGGDETLDKFMFHGDGAAKHGQRLADWIIERMGGEGGPYTDSGRGGGMRQISHTMAWFSQKRDPEDHGVRFKLDDCRIWMRLMFMSGREVGLKQHEVFWKWYVGFIRGWIGVYESRSPEYVEVDGAWSENEENVSKYVADGKKMIDVTGLGRDRRLDQDSLFGF